MAILGKDGQALKGALEWAGKGAFAVQATVSAVTAGVAIYDNDANAAGVTAKAALDITMGAISVWGGPVGWAVGAVYFVGDAAGWWGDWGKAAGHQ